MEDAMMRNEKRNDSDPFGRKPTSLRTLVLLILMLATATGSGLANARVKDCGELPGFGDPPVKREALGENWQFNKDADKLPIFRKLIADGGLNLTPSNSKPPSFCKSFLRDLMAGKPIEVIEPELEVMSVDDPRLGPFPCYRREDGTVLGECGPARGKARTLASMQLSFGCCRESSREQWISPHRRGFRGPSSTRSATLSLLPV
jgi:hypothetical protein